LGVLVAAATGKPLAGYLSEKIWRPYGTERDAEWMIDDVGHEQGGCCLAMTLRDQGRVGQFILDGARINGQPIVPEHWLRQATRTEVSTGAASGYGDQWWTRDDGTFEARGIYGQTLHIGRARRLVVVINSAADQPTGRASGRARQEFITKGNAESNTRGVDRLLRRPPPAPGHRSQTAAVSVDGLPPRAAGETDCSADLSEVSGQQGLSPVRASFR
jgi:CubicO group peptidase (beta-lactamase class C family)